MKLLISFFVLLSIICQASVSYSAGAILTTTSEDRSDNDNYKNSSTNKLSLVVLNPGALEVIRALDAHDQVIGIPNHFLKQSAYWGDITKATPVGSWREPNLESIITLKPDYIICYKLYPDAELEQNVNEIGIKVVRTDIFCFDEMDTEIRLLGNILNRNKEADALLDWIHEKREFIRSLVAKTKDRPRVYQEGAKPFLTIGPGARGYDLAVSAGGLNITCNLKYQYPPVSPEWVIERNPEYIVKYTHNPKAYEIDLTGYLQSEWDLMLKRPELQVVEAIRRKRVYVMLSDLLYGPKGIVGAAYMAKWFHPEICRALDPEGIHEDYLKRFQGLDLRGTYTFPRTLLEGNGGD